MTNRLYALFFILITVVGFFACKKLTKNITLNVNSGYLNYRVLLFVKDANTNSVPAGVTVTIAGNGANYVYYMDGTKNVLVNKTTGSTTIGLAPGLVPTSGKPVTFTAVITAPGYLPVNKHIVIEQGMTDQLMQVKMVNLSSPPSIVHIADQSLPLTNGTLTTAASLQTQRTTSSGNLVTVTFDTGTQFISPYYYYTTPTPPHFNGNYTNVTLVHGDSTITSTDPVSAPYTTFQTLQINNSFVAVNFYVAGGATILVGGADATVSSGSTKDSIFGEGTYSGNFYDNVFNQNHSWTMPIDSTAIVSTPAFSFTTFSSYYFSAATKPVNVSITLDPATMNPETSAAIKAGDSINLYGYTGLWTSNDYWVPCNRVAIVNSGGNLVANFQTLYLGQFIAGWHEWNNGVYGLNTVNLTNNSNYTYAWYDVYLYNQTLNQSAYLYTINFSSEVYAQINTGNATNGNGTSFTITNYTENTSLRIFPSAYTMPCVTINKNADYKEAALVSSGTATENVDITSLFTIIQNQVITFHGTAINTSNEKNVTNMYSLGIYITPTGTKDYTFIGTIYNGFLQTYCLQVGSIYDFYGDWKGQPKLLGTYKITSTSLDTTISYPF